MKAPGFHKPVKGKCGAKLRWIEKASYYSPEQKKLWGKYAGDQERRCQGAS